jgi:copper resistance protein C
LSRAGYTRAVTVTPSARVVRALLLAVAILALAALPAIAHAELVSSDPADEAEVQSPFDGPITLTYDEALFPGSDADLIGPDGSTVASAEVDDDKLVFTLDAALDPGAYLIRWVTIAVDRDVHRGELTFTVVAPPPTPSAAPSAVPSASPTPSPAPLPSPTPSGGGSPTGVSGDVLLPLLAAVIAIGAIGAFLLRNRRTAGR